MHKILLVEDSGELTDFLYVLLQINDFETVCVFQKELMQKLNTFIPDVILLDMELNHIDGIELCKEIKEHHLYNKIPVILLSGNSEYLKNYKANGVNYIMEKPFDIHSLIKKINQYLNG